MPGRSPPRLARAAVRLAALLAPAGRRERMRREWDAELRAAAAHGEAAPRLVRHALGAFADARELAALERVLTNRGGESMFAEWTAGWGRDARVAVRGLLRTPGFTAIAALTLALGMGGSAAIYTLLDRVVLDPLPYPEADRLVRLMNQVPGVGPGERWHMSTAQYVYFTDQAETLEAVGLYLGTGTTLQTAAGPERARATVVTAEVLPLLGARAHLGRSITEEDDTPEAPAVAVLSHGFWTRAFGADPGVIGRTLGPVFSDEPVEVIGVLEPGVELPGLPPTVATDIWTPLRLDRGGPFFNSHVLPMIARLAPGAEVEAAEAELARLTSHLPETFPQAYSQGFLDRYGFRTEVTPLKTDVVGDMARNLWILFGAVGLVLLIACANVANLFLVRTEARHRELSVRAALGAGRGQLARHLLVEGLSLAAAGGALALLVGWWAVPALTAMAPAELPRVHGVALGGGTVLFTLALALLVGVGLALHPILGLARERTGTVLADGGRTGSVGPGRARFRAALVVTQVALALVLAVSASLLVESMRRLGRVDPGFEPAGVLAVELHTSRERHPDDHALWRFYADLLERVGTLPGVVAAGMSTELPVQGSYGCTVQGFQDAEVYARLEAAGMTTCAGQNWTTPGFFEALGIPVLQGRVFEAADLDDPARASVVVSRAFAERFWPGEDPIGKGVAASGRNVGPFYRVVGVVGDVPAGSVEGEAAIAVHYPVVRDPAIEGEMSWWWPGSTQLVVKAGVADPASLLPAIRGAVAELDPEAALANAQRMEDVIAASMTRLAFTSLLLGLAAGTALLLAAVGLYGVVSWSVSRRTREIGMRMAVGARPGDVERMIVGRSLGLAAIGLVVGTAAAFAATRVLSGLLYGVAPGDPRAFAAAVLVLVAVTVLASWIPARRVSRVDPSSALREA